MVTFVVTESFLVDVSPFETVSVEEAELQRKRMNSDCSTRKIKGRSIGITSVDNNIMVDCGVVLLQHPVCTRCPTCRCTSVPSTGCAEAENGIPKNKNAGSKRGFCPNKREERESFETTFCVREREFFFFFFISLYRIFYSVSKIY